MQQFYLRNESITKVCVACNLLKYSKDFYSNKRNCDGLASECKECLRKRSSEYINSTEGKTNRSNYYHNVIKNNTNKYLFLTTRANAKTKNLEHSISEFDIVIPECCPIFKIPLKLSDSGYQTDNSPSIDRINNTIGYVKSNIVVVSWKANNIKSFASLEEMKMILENWNILSNKDVDNKEKEAKLYYKAKERAKSKGLLFDLEKSDIKIPFKCPILGTNICLNNTNQKDDSPTVDRINNNLGYIKGNIRIISWRANNLKGQASFSDYKSVFDFYNNLIQ